MHKPCSVCQPDAERPRLVARRGAIKTVGQPKFGQKRQDSRTQRGAGASEGRTPRVQRHESRSIGLAELAELVPPKRNGRSWRWLSCRFRLDEVPVADVAI